MHSDIIAYRADLTRLLEEARGPKLPIVDFSFGFQDFFSKADLPELNETGDSAIFHYVSRIVFPEMVIDLGFGRHDLYTTELLFDGYVHWPSLKVFSVRPGSFLDAIGKNFRIPFDLKSHTKEAFPCWTAAFASNYLIANSKYFRNATKAQLDLMREKFGERLFFDAERQKSLDLTRDISKYVPLFHQGRYDVFLESMKRYDGDPSIPVYLQKMLSYATKKFS